MIDDPRPVFIHSADAPFARSCPVCRAILNASTGLSLDPDDPQPVLGEGAITSCAYCLSILVATERAFRLATDADLDELDPTMRALIFEFTRSHGSQS